MATTAAQITKAILQDILVHGSESELEAVEFQDAVFAMNSYMTALDANGVSLGYTVVDDLSDLITVAAGAILGVQKNVALQMVSQFGATADIELQRAAEFGMKAMLKLSRNIQPMSHPSTFPLGSGNEGHFRRNRRFYPGSGENILTETDRNIGLETET